MNERERLEKHIAAIEAIRNRCGHKVGKNNKCILPKNHEGFHAANTWHLDHKNDRRDSITTPETTYSFPSAVNVWSK